jgi:hypothetical protein
MLSVLVSLVRSWKSIPTNQLMLTFAASRGWNLIYNPGIGLGWTDVMESREEGPGAGAANETSNTLIRQLVGKRWYSRCIMNALGYTLFRHYRRGREQRAATRSHLTKLQNSPDHVSNTPRAGCYGKYRAAMLYLSACTKALVHFNAAMMSM